MARISRRVVALVVAASVCTPAVAVATTDLAAERGPSAAVYVKRVPAPDVYVKRSEADVYVKRSEANVYVKRSEADVYVKRSQAEQA